MKLKNKNILKMLNIKITDQDMK